MRLLSAPSTRFAALRRAVFLLAARWVQTAPRRFRSLPQELNMAYTFFGASTTLDFAGGLMVTGAPKSL